MNTQQIPVREFSIVHHASPEPGNAISGKFTCSVLRDGETTISYQDLDGGNPASITLPAAVSSEMLAFAVVNTIRPKMEDAEANRQSALETLKNLIQKPRQD